MKTKLFLATLLMVTLSIRSQNFSGGLVAGASTSAVKIEHTGQEFTNVLNGNNIQGFEAGAFVKLMLSPVYLKPMALYNFSTGEINTSEVNIGENSNFTMHRIETPVLLGLKILKPLSIEAGPVYNYILQSSNDNSDVSLAQSSGLGYRVGLALEIKRLLINGSYSGVTIKADGPNGTTFKEPYKIVFGLGIKLGKIEE